jgi:hypothetical protein
LCENAAIGFQPEGLSDSSRWSEHSADHGRSAHVVRTPEGCHPVSDPPVSGVDLFSIVVRWSTLRSDHRLLSDSPSGCRAHPLPLLVLYLCWWATILVPPDPGRREDCEFYPTTKQPRGVSTSENAARCVPHKMESSRLWSDAHGWIAPGTLSRWADRSHTEPISRSGG